MRGSNPTLSIPTLMVALVVPASLACVIVDDTPSGDTAGECMVGHEGCPCTSGGACNPGFFCDPNQNLCLLDDCPVGQETCACTPEGACDPGLQCASKICVEDPATCTPGTVGCPCTAGGGCDPDLACISELCVDDSELDGSSGDPPDCNAENCTVWVCGDVAPDCPCDCTAGCTGNIAVNCGTPAPCVEVEDCDDAGGVCEPVSKNAVGCSVADSSG